MVNWLSPSLLLVLALYLHYHHDKLPNDNLIFDNSIPLMMTSSKIMINKKTSEQIAWLSIKITLDFIALKELLQSLKSFFFHFLEKNFLLFFLSFFIIKLWLWLFYCHLFPFIHSFSISNFLSKFGGVLSLMSLLYDALHFNAF